MNYHTSLQGEVGRNGAQGPQGETGAMGSPGLPGVSGEPGLPGLRGEKVKLFKTMQFVSLNEFFNLYKLKDSGAILQKSFSYRVRKERREWVSKVKMEKMGQKDPRDLLVHQDLQDNLSALSIQGQGAEK